VSVLAVGFGQLQSRLAHIASFHSSLNHVRPSI